MTGLFRKVFRMNRAAIFAIAAVAVFASRSVFALDATLMADGSVRFGPDGSYSLKPILFLPEWKGTTSAGGYSVKKPGVASYPSIPAGKESA